MKEYFYPFIFQGIEPCVLHNVVLSNRAAEPFVDPAVLSQYTITNTIMKPSDVLKRVNLTLSPWQENTLLLLPLLLLKLARSSPRLFDF